MKVTNRIGSVFTLSSSAGCDLLPIVVGQIITEAPMSLIYLQLGSASICLAAFAAAVIVARRSLSG